MIVTEREYKEEMDIFGACTKAPKSKLGYSSDVKIQALCFFLSLGLFLFGDIYHSGPNPFDITITLEFLHDLYEF